MTYGGKKVKNRVVKVRGKGGERVRGRSEKRRKRYKIIMIVTFDL